MRPFQIAVLGSFRRHWELIAAAAAAFRTLGCTVLTPPPGRPLDPSAEFVRLDQDADQSDEAIVSGVLATIDQADAVFFCNPDGYLGPSAALELGYGLAGGRQIFVAAPPTDPGLAVHGLRVADPAGVVAHLTELHRSRFNETLSPRASLADLQRYNAAMVERRGFTSYQTLQVMLLLVEEVGELAKALRKREGLKMDPARAGEYGQVGEEMADILLYLLSLANWTGVDLATALQEKERRNEQRTWRA